jgi:hypothetical protein
MMSRLAPALALLVLAIAAGCDGGNDEAATQPTSVTIHVSTDPAALERAARSSLSENRRLSVYVLWNNKIPPWAEASTRGPALAGLRTAAADRKRRGIRVRLLSDRFEVLSIRLDPSYMRATAIARGRQRVRPHKLNGKPAGRAVVLNEKARIELRRVGRMNRFVVWSVQVLD